MAGQVVLVATALAALIAAQGVYYLFVYLGERRRADLHRRLQALSRPSEGKASLFLRERRMARSAGLERLLRSVTFANRLERVLEQTDLPFTVAAILGLALALAAVATFGLWMVLHSPLALVGVPLGLAIPVVLVLNARVRRSHKVSLQLPDALEMMTRSLRAGHGIAAAFKLVAEEMPPPVAVEFGRCFEEQKFGVDFREAVGNMTERVPGNLDLKIFAVSAIVQRETGGNLVEILEQIASTIRERFKFYGKLRALTAEGRVSGYILGGLPIVCLILVSLFNPSYLGPLYLDPIGRLIALGGLALWALGILWMVKMVRVDY
jgi:tight adherence protein B